LDQKDIRYGGGASSVEACDLLSLGRDIIHVKMRSGPREFSHLFAQGLNSAELLVMEPDFRAEVRKRVSEEHAKVFKLSGSVYDASKIRVVYAVVTDRSGPLDIPFFSKLSLRHAVKRLRALRYSVAISKIEMDALRAKLSRVKRKAKTF